MLNPKLQEWMTRGYVKVGDISYNIALNMKKGKNFTASQKSRYEQGIKLYLILDVLFRHVTFQETTNVPTLWRITEVQTNALVRCLIKIGELDKVPVVPSLFPTSKPTVIQTGAQGATVTGPAGTNANINVVLKAGEKQLKISQSVILGVKTFELSFVTYVLPQLLVEIQGGKIFEIGDDRNFNINITTQKGTQNLVTYLCDSGAVNTTLQGVLNIIAANDIALQPYQVVVPVTTQQISQTFIITINDGVNNVVVMDTINFYHPFLFGATTGATPTLYTSLSKLIAAQANRSFAFNDVDKYFWICYPSSYGTLTKIRDANGFNVISDFTTAVQNVTSTGLDNNYTEEYRTYRTIVKTSIDDSYSIEF